MLPKKRQIRMTPRLRQLLASQRQAFRDKFGREPAPGDPVFFDPLADQPRRWSAQTMAAAETAFVEAARIVGVREELVYAFCKTGRIVTARNSKSLTPSELAEWKATIKEYRNRKHRDRQ